VAVVFEEAQALMVHRIEEGIPRALCLLDKNPVSSSYGCFDRRYWQYKMTDFPSGMQQELIRPLAWIHARDTKVGGRYGGERAADMIRGAMTYFARTIHKEGALDDYFPYERALGATAYSATALIDAALITGILPDETMHALQVTGRFLAASKEAGRLSNHLAIAACALGDLAELTGDHSWMDVSDTLVTRLINEQSSEGWFIEYEGCDLGYQSVTLEFLARRHRRLPTSETKEALQRQCSFLVEFVHPDGSLGGEYCSRNTYNFYPGGAAIIGGENRDAAAIFAGYLNGITTGAENHLEDDGVFGHMLSSYTTVAQCKSFDIPPLPEGPPKDGFTAYPESGFYTARSGPVILYGNINKGGGFKAFSQGAQILSDTGFVGEIGDGTIVFQNKPGISTGSVGDDVVKVEGHLMRYSSKRLSMIAMIGLRFLALLFGRFSWFSHAVRRLMQAALIYNKDSLDAPFRRTITRSEWGFKVEDMVRPPAGDYFIQLWLASDCVNTHVVTSDSYQKTNLEPWRVISNEPGPDGFITETTRLEAKEN